jgi:hypothetical protein
MSFAAVYHVTRALRMLLHSQLSAVSASAVVTLLPPGETLPAASGVNLYLYRVQESPFTKNQAWRGDRITAASPDPVLGLQLTYLITPLGIRPDETSFEQGDDAHTMLGVAMLALHGNPILNDVHLPGFDADSVLPAFIRASFEQIKVTLLPTSLDELSKLWATINQPYRLSVAYEVSLVEVAPTPPPPAGGGIVLSTGVDVITLDPPRLEALAPSAGALARVDAGDVLHANVLSISGFGFQFPGQVPTVQVGGRPAIIQPAPPPSDQTLAVLLPTDLDGGPQADVRVTLNGQTSAPVVFAVAPWLAETRPIRTALDPVQGPADLTLILSGTGFGPAPQNVRLDGPGGITTVATAPTSTDTRATAALPAGLASGMYSARLVRGDQAASNARTLEVIPRVDTPIGVAQVIVSSVQVHRLTIAGARLTATDARVILDGVTYVAGPNGSANQLIYTLGRLLEPGSHAVAVRIDGRTSRTVTVGI